jgi:hypothetical protein
VVCAVLLLAATNAAAQPAVPPCNPQPKTYQDHWCRRIAEIVAAVKGAPTGARDEVQRLVEVTGPNLAAFLLFAQARSKELDLRLIEDARTDKQVGAPANAAGSGSLVSKGSVPKVLSLAVENGALTQAVSGTAVTFRGNLVGWLDLVQNQGFIASYEDDSPVVRQLRRVSYSFTLNTTTPAVQASTASGVGGFSPAAIREQFKRFDQQLAGYSVRLAIWDQRDPRIEANRAAIGTLLDTQGVKVLQSDRAFSEFITSDEYLLKWLPHTAEMLNDPSLAAPQVQKILYRQLEALRVLMVNRIENFDVQVGKVLTALDAFDKARVRVFQEMQKRPLVAFEYVNARSPDLPDQSTFRVIAEGQLGPRLDLTANVALTVQGSGHLTAAAPQEIDGVRDFQAAAQVEVPLGSLERRLSGTMGIGVPVLGIAYLSQKLTDRAAVSFGGTSFALDPGWVHAVQARLTIPVKGSGVKMPLSVSFANRTELLREKTIRGHLGLTFDMDVLSSLIR